MDKSYIAENFIEYTKYISNINNKLMSKVKDNKISVNDASDFIKQIQCRHGWLLNNLFLVSENGIKQDKDTAKSLSYDLKISCEYDETGDILHISMPALLPATKSTYRPEIYKNVLVDIIGDALKDKDIERKKRCILYIHSGKTIRDYDNMEQKSIQDMIKSFMLKDDDPANLTVINTCGKAEHTGTDIYVSDLDTCLMILKNRS